MEEQKSIPFVAVVILIAVILGAVLLFLVRKKTLISPVPEGSTVKVIFTSPPPTDVPPTVTPKTSITPTKKVTPTKANTTPVPTKSVTTAPKPSATPNATATP